MGSASSEDDKLIVVQGQKGCGIRDRLVLVPGLEGLKEAAVGRFEGLHSLVGIDPGEGFPVLHCQVHQIIYTLNTSLCKGSAVGVLRILWCLQ